MFQQGNLVRRELSQVGEPLYEGAERTGSGSAFPRGASRWRAAAAAQEVRIVP